MTKVNHGRVRDTDGLVISSSTDSGETEDRISGSPECAVRPTLLRKETTEGEGTEEGDVEAARMVGVIGCAGELSRGVAATAGSGEVAEPWKFSVDV